MELGDVITLPLAVTVPAGATTGTVVYQQLLIRLMKKRNFTIASGTASATGTINDNDLLWPRSLLLRLLKEDAVFEFS
jgi:hypothetical protein